VRLNEMSAKTEKMRMEVAMMPIVVRFGKRFPLIF
jgi:hypothetical protein